MIPHPQECFEYLKEMLKSVLRRDDIISADLPVKIKINPNIHLSLLTTSEGFNTYWESLDVFLFK